MTSKILAQLRKRAERLEAECRQMLEGAGESGLTVEQRTAYDEKFAELQGVYGDIERAQKLETEIRAVVGDPEPPAAGDPGDPADPENRGRPKVGTDREAAKPFTTIGEQLRAIVTSSAPGAEPDKRLLHIASEHRAATGQGESTPADGGFLVQQDFASELLKRVYDVGQILSRVRRRPLGENSNGLKMNAVDEDSRADGSRYGGLQSHWVGEGQVIPASQMKFRRIELDLRKIAVLLYATDELLRDAPALTAEVNDTVPQEIRFKVEDAIVNGNGVNKPLGFMAGAAKIEVAKENAQAADTVVAANVTNMMARMWSPSFANAVWLIDQSVIAQLPLMTIGNQPIWTPPNAGFKEAPAGMLLGKPIIPVEYLKQLGDAGDIVLVDLSQYMLIDKDQIQSAVSIHVRFLYDEQAFRWIYRVDGQPQWKKVLTPKHGGATLAPVITLAERA